MWHWNWFLAASLSPAGQGCLSFALGTMEKVGVLVPRGFPGLLRSFVVTLPLGWRGGSCVLHATLPPCCTYYSARQKAIFLRDCHMYTIGFQLQRLCFCFFSLPFDIFIWSQSLLTNQTILCCYSDRVVFVAPLQFIVICCFYIMVKSLTHSRNLRRPI